MSGLRGAISTGAALQHPVVDSSPPSQASAFPLPGGGVLFARARLDNRSDVVRRLGLSADQSRSSCDAALVAAAFEAWGPGCGAGLVGAWAYAAQDVAEGRCVLSRDAFGLAPLYYHQSKDRIWFSDRLPDLLRLAGLPRHLNVPALAQLGLGTKRDTSCFQKGAQKAPPAQALIFARDGTMRRLRYWDPADAPEVRFARDADYEEAFLALYDEVVAGMLDGPGPIGIALSSGLDSGSIAALAAPRLARRGSPLRAYCWVPTPGARFSATPGRNSNEWEDVQQLTAHIGNIDATRVTGYPQGLIAAIRHMLSITDDVDNAVAGWGWYHGVLSQAAADGTGTILTGDFGNLTISQGRRETHAPMSARLRQEAKARWRALRFGRPRHPRLIIRPDFVRRALAGVEPADPELNGRWRHARQPLRSLYNILHSGGVAVSGEIAGSMGMTLCTPPIDRRMVDFCNGVPADQISRGTETRRLIRRSFEGKIPQALLWKDVRGLPGSDYAAAIAEEHEEVMEILDAAERSPVAREALDLPWLRRSASALSIDPSAIDVLSAGLLVRGVAYAMFLQTFEDIAPA